MRLRATSVAAVCILALGCGHPEEPWSDWYGGKAEEQGSSDLTPEPQTLDPTYDRSFIEKLGLLTRGAGHELRRFNLLIIGQDSRQKTGTVMLPGPAGPESRVSLGSRSDSINIMSVDRVSGKLTIFSFYRGNIPHCTMPAWDEQKWGSVQLAALYRTGREVFISCMEEMIANRLRNSFDVRPSFTDYIGVDGTFRIHALLEADFTSFKKLFGAGLNAVTGKTAFSLGWIYKGHLTQAISIGISARDILWALRYRHIYPAGGYQRAFNHAKFLATMLGYLAFGLAKKPDMIEIFADVYSELSGSLSLQELLQSFQRVDGSGRSALVSAGYKKDVSPVRVVLFGAYSNDDHLIFENGQADTKFIQHRPGRTNMLTLVNPGIELIPGPNDCDGC